MRRYIYYLLSGYLIMNVLEGHAQYSSIFGVNSTEWVFEWHNLDIGGQDTVYVQKDTIINSVTWKKIMVKSNHSIYAGGLLREDTIVGQVWYKGLEFFGNPYDTAEILSFDFSLEVNDSFDISNMYKGSNPFCSLPNKSDSLKVDKMSYFNLFNYEKSKIYRIADCCHSQAV